MSVNLAVVVTVLLVACSSEFDDSARSVEPTESGGLSSQDSQSGVLDTSAEALVQKYGLAPIAAFNISMSDSELLLEAQESLIRDCIESRGLEYQSPDQHIETVGGNDWDGFLGLTSLDRAEKLGYSSDTFSSSSSDASPSADPAEPLTEDAAIYLEALYGPSFVRVLKGEEPLNNSPEDGTACSPGAANQLLPSGPVPNQSIQAELLDQASITAQTDPKVVESFEQWKRCMSERSYSVSEIPQPIETDAPSATDIKKAISDVECKQASNLIDTYISTLYQAEEQAIKQHQDEVDAFAKFNQERLAIASDVVSEHND